MGRTSTTLINLIIVSGALAITPMVAWGQSAPVTPELISEMHFRCVGPAVTGGRIHDVEALPDDPSTIYVATASGGLWKSSNKGTTWKPIFDDQPVSTFGDLAIAASDPDIIWAGTGEQNNRQSTSWGNGVYRSLDGGETWSHRGLVETRHIGRVVIHPENPEVVYVAALGNLWKASTERGVFKTTDGGQSWSKVLYVDELTGMVDLVMDPSNPAVLYAAAYQRLRRTWGFNGGGPGSGIYKTTDGGQTWRELTAGIPEGDKGRIGLTIAQTNPRLLYAIIQHAKEGGVYRSEDGGRTWTKVNDLNPRPMYYSHISVDPTDENRVYVLGVELYMSEDGGHVFRQLPTRPTYDVGVHSDHHTLWIDPTNPEHFYLAGDAGLHETWDRGETYSHLNNFPIGQFYAVGVDMREPYFIYGGMQDTHSWMGPSATRWWIGILNDDWRQIGFGDGMYHQPDPTNHRYVYSNAQNGNLTRLDTETGDILNIRPYPPEKEKPYRFDWVTPSLISHHNSKKVYFGGNRLFITKDRGVSWQRTEDLSRQIERDSLYLMGVQGAEKMLSKNDGNASFGEITTIAESALNAKVIWVGTDDGNLQVSRDGGKTWTEVSRNIKQLPDGSYVSRVIASRKGAGTAYAAFDAHRDGDFAPYVFKTADFGQNWTGLTNGLPPEGSVNVIMEHLENSDLLFLGTEHALFISTTGGEHWIPFESNLPTTLYDDLTVHPRDNDLIVGTHGRSIWVLDDLAPLVEWSPGIAGSPAHLFSIRPATMFQYWKATSYRGQGAYAGENPPFGALISYHLAAPADSVEVVIRRVNGSVIRRLQGAASAGIIHRISWDLRHEPPPYRREEEEKEGLVKLEHILPKLPRPVEPQGPFVAPGTYTVMLKAGDVSTRRTVRVQGDPRLPLSKKQWRAREDFLLDVLWLQRQVWESTEQADLLKATFTQHKDSVNAIEDLSEEILAGAQAAADTAQARAKRIRSLRGDIYGLAGEFNGRATRQGSLYPPTDTHVMRKTILEAKLATEMEGIKELEIRESELPRSVE